MFLCVPLGISISDADINSPTGLHGLTGLT